MNCYQARVTFRCSINRQKEIPHTLNSSDFRPTVLTLFLLKTIVKAVDNDIKTEILEKVLLHHSQYSYYRAGTSTETTLVQLTDEIQDVLTNKEKFVYALLDIEGAFDGTGI